MVRASISKFVLLAAIGLIAGCGGGSSSPSPPPPPGGGTPPPPPPVNSTTNMASKTEVSEFLAWSAFGASKSDQDSLVDTDAADWLKSQMDLPPTLYLPPLRNRHENGEEIEHWEHTNEIWKGLISGDDELRQRMVFALSQILVVSDRGVNKPLSMVHYMDILSTHAFGNYRDLLQDVTYSPAMADYLTYLRNKKGDPERGRMPDENYARELLQLFTIGLVELNMDGTPKTGTDGKPVEIYTNEDIVGLARVFTGLSLKGSGFWDADVDGTYSPLQVFPEKHSELEKSFLGTTIPAGTGADASITQALDHIFDHPNLAPFVSRQLIQRFTASHPDPAYVERVANAFESGRFTADNDVVFGTGERGDLAATIAAILLDHSLFDDNEPGPHDGKIREPILRFIHWAKAFDVREIDPSNEWWLLYSSESNRLSQQPFSSPSVFNFYRPGFQAPGSETGAQNLTAPEFQIVHEGAAVGFANYMAWFVRDHSPTVNENRNTFIPNYSDEVKLADDPNALADHLNELLHSGRMSTTSRDRIIAVLNEIPIRENAEDAAEDRLTRVHAAVTMAVTDPAFTIQL